MVVLATLKRNAKLAQESPVARNINRIKVMASCIPGEMEFLQFMQLVSILWILGASVSSNSRNSIGSTLKNFSKLLGSSATSSAIKVSYQPSCSLFGSHGRTQNLFSLLFIFIIGLASSITASNWTWTASTAQSA